MAAAMLGQAQSAGLARVELFEEWSVYGQSPLRRDE
jgi:hypothetical protein